MRTGLKIAVGAAVALAAAGGFAFKAFSARSAEAAAWAKVTDFSLEKIQEYNAWAGEPSWDWFTQTFSDYPKHSAILTARVDELNCNDAMTRRDLVGIGVCLSDNHFPARKAEFERALAEIPKEQEGARAGALAALSTMDPTVRGLLGPWVARTTDHKDLYLALSLVLPASHEYPEDVDTFDLLPTLRALEDQLNERIQPRLPWLVVRQGAGVQGWLKLVVTVKVRSTGKDVVLTSAGHPDVGGVAKELSYDFAFRLETIGPGPGADLPPFSSQPNITAVGDVKVGKDKSVDLSKFYGAGQRVAIEGAARHLGKLFGVTSP